MENDYHRYKNGRYIYINMNQKLCFHKNAHFTQLVEKYTVI